jgi:uncharacterized protein (DUF934 family)
MPLLKNDTFVHDTWAFLGADDAMPDGGNVAIPFARLKEQWETLAKFPGQLGAVLKNSDDIDDVALFLPHLALVVLPFPAFGDGRSYSLAKQIREHDYRAELRAGGDILPDQLQFMLQVGFSTFEVTERFPLQMWQAAAKQMSLAYQRGLFRRSAEAEVWSERHKEAQAWEEQPHAG